MKRQLIRHKEPLNAEERTFLRKKEWRERKQFLKVIRAMLLLCFLIPFLFSWYRAIEDVPDPFSYSYYFLGVLILVCFSGTIVWVVYSSNLRKLQTDIRKNKKTVEQVRITRKQYMKVNNTFYFYLNSPVKLSIEVSAEDYSRMEEGDEINIEYTPESKFYLGYY